MKWDDLRRSSNIEDIRFKGGASRGAGRGSLRLLLPIAQMLIGTKVGRIVLVVGVVAYFLGFNPLALLDSSSSSSPSAKVQSSVADDRSAEFISAVLAQTEDIWGQQFAQLGGTYKEPKLVLFRQSVQSACGYASAQVGPFYCPADQKVYLDLGFFDELSQRHDAPGDFAQAYVVAHEIGHHVQNLVGTLNKSHKAKQLAQGDEKKANAIQVKVELQADCYAGVWAHHINAKGNIIEQGDIEEALNAASAIGDDTLQKKAHGHVVPDSFTHGSSAQRMQWFDRGFKNGNMRACNTGA
ncbi:MAG: neutral zinc metallopeptidase [Campylobacterota bacterium]|nr:neutral zinc metallopeptidase [Campylobacterota bacterium]